MSMGRLLAKLALNSIGVTVLCLPTVNSLAAPSLRPGKWEMSTQTQIVGIAQPMPPLHMTECLSPTQARDPVKTATDRFRRSVAPGQQCNISHRAESGRSVTWSVTCTGSQPLTSRGRVTFDNSSAYHGSMSSEIMSPIGPVKMMQSFQGRRLGACSR